MLFQFSQPIRAGRACFNTLSNANSVAIQPKRAKELNLATDNPLNSMQLNDLQHTALFLGIQGRMPNQLSGTSLL
jgi:hypothetical protein